MSWKAPDAEVRATGWPAVFILLAFAAYTLLAVLRTVEWAISKF